MDPCANCGADNYVEDFIRGDSVCADCGAVAPERMMDEQLEKRNFMDSGKDHMRGSELDKYLTFASQSTVIGTGKGNLQRAQNRLKPSAMSTSERNLSDGFQNIRTYETMFQLPRKVVNTARDLMAEYEKKKAKTMQGARSPAFALAMVFLSLNLHASGRTIKELAATAAVDERDIRSYLKRIQKVIPASLAKHTTPEDFIRIIVSDIEAPLLLERFGCEIARRATDHVCNGDCISEHLTGKKNSTLAAAAVLAAARHAELDVVPENVAASAQIGAARALAVARLMEGHWSAMFSDMGGSSDKLLAELRALAKRTEAALAPSIVVDANAFEGVEKGI